MRPGDYARIAATYDDTLAVPWNRGPIRYILRYMKQILIEIDDRCARDLARVAPAKKRVRAEFIRLAIRRAIDLALDRSTEAAYRARPLAGEMTLADRVGWDADNEFARPATLPKKARSHRGAKKKKAA